MNWRSKPTARPSTSRSPSPNPCVWLPNWAEKNEQLAQENKEMAPKAIVLNNCVALRQESLASPSCIR